MKNYVGSSIAANLFRGLEGVGGHIRFDETGLTFEPHSFNFQTDIARIEYADIVAVGKRKTAGIVPNGMFIDTRDGVQYRFVINKRNDVIEFLNSMVTPG